MNDKFEWITEKDKEWSDSPPPKKPLFDRKKQNRLLAVLGLLLLVLIPAGLFLLNTLEKRVDETSNIVEEEVINTQSLFLDAVIQTDYELLESLLPEEDLKWRELILQQMDNSLLVDRPPLGLALADEMVDSSSMFTITLSPDLTRAEVNSLLPFNTLRQEEPGRIVNLVTSTAFEREGDRWVMAAPPEDSEYWGDWESITVDDLKITVPDRDSEIAVEMAEPLSRLIDDICTLDRIKCPRNFQFELHLDRQPDTINRLRNSINSRSLVNFNSRYYLPLPTPTLVGRPTDPAGVEALYRGYASWLATTLITNFTDSQELENMEGVAQLLEGFGLESPPPPPVLLPRPPKTFKQAELTLPSEDILLLCSGQGSINLLRLDLNGENWSDEWSNFEWSLSQHAQNLTGYITPAPKHLGAMIHVNYFDNEIPQWQSYWWQNSDLLLLIDDQEPYEVWPPTFQKDINRIGRFLRVTRDNQSGELQELTTSWFDMGQCLAGPCQIQMASGYPIWSKDGNHTLVMAVNQDEGMTLFRGDKDAQPIEYLGLGSSPFWISNTTFGFVRPSQVSQDGQILEDAGEEIAVGQITGDTTGNSVIRSIIHTKFLRDALPEGRRTGPLKILYAAANPRIPDQWILAAAPESILPAGDSILFELNIETQELSVLTDLQKEGLLLPIFSSPSSGYLAFITAIDNSTTFYLYDTNSGRLTKSSHSFPVDWTDDDRWLLFVERAKLVLIAPGSDAEFEIPINLSNCYSAAFTSEE